MEITFGNVSLLIQSNVARGQNTFSKREKLFPKGKDYFQKGNTFSKRETIFPKEKKQYKGIHFFLGIQFFKNPTLNF